MTIRQQAQELLMRLPESELQKVLQYMLSLASATSDANTESNEEDDIKARLKALAELRKARKELTQMDIDRMTEVQRQVETEVLTPSLTTDEFMKRVYELREKLSKYSYGDIDTEMATALIEKYGNII